MLNANFEKTKNENSHLSSEVTRLRAIINDLQSKNNHLNDAQTLVTEIESRGNEINRLNNEIVSLQGTVGLRDNNIKALEKELDVAHRAINVQNKYESGGAIPNGNAREMMRSLYYEIGRRQADIHSLTLSLVDANKQLDLCKLQLQDSQADNNRLQDEKDKLASNVEVLNSQTVEYTAEIELLKEKLHSSKELTSKLELQIEDMSKRLSEVRHLHEEVMEEKNTKIAQLVEFQNYLQTENHQLASRIESHQQSLSYFENVHKINEQRLETEISELRLEVENLCIKSQECENLKLQLEEMRQSLHEAVNAKENTHHSLNEIKFSAERQEIMLKNTLEDTTRRADDLQSELLASREFETAVIAERNEALEALQQTIQATRELSQKYQRERELRLATEAVMEDLRRAKESVSTAVLDALHREREKSKKLEAALHALPAEILYQHRIDLNKSTASLSVISRPSQYSGEVNQSVSATPSGFTAFDPSRNSAQYTDSSSTKSEERHPNTTYFSSTAEMDLFQGRARKDLEEIVRPVSIVDELKRLRDELRRIEDTAPSVSASESFTSTRQAAMSHSSNSSTG